MKTIFDAKTGQLLGAHMVGAEVTELIQGFVIAMQLETTEEDLMHTVFPHPTLQRDDARERARCLRAGDPCVGVRCLPSPATGRDGEGGTADPRRSPASPSPADPSATEAWGGEPSARRRSNR